MKRAIVLFQLYLIFSATFIFAAKVDTLHVESFSMSKKLKAAVVLPQSYDKSKVAYPVLYLLHGAYGHFDNWLSKTPNKDLVKNLSDQYNLIIVMPEGESFSFYINSPFNSGSQFETFITKEVINAVDKTYRTIANKKARAITGLSMGGHGALYLSALHPEFFCAAGSMSGVVDLSFMLNNDASVKIKEFMQPIFGNMAENQERLAKFNVSKMIDVLQSNKLPLIIDCGVDDFLIVPNRAFHQKLMAAKIEHDYTERPGAHSWVYWENTLPYHVLFFNKILARS